MVMTGHAGTGRRDAVPARVQDEEDIEDERTRDRCEEERSESR